MNMWWSMSDKTIRVNCASDYRIDDVHTLVGLKSKKGSCRQIDEVRKVAESLEKDGLAEPLDVWIHGDHVYLVDGDTRVFALNYLRGRYGYRIPPIPVRRVRPDNGRDMYLLVHGSIIREGVRWVIER